MPDAVRITKRVVDTMSPGSTIWDRDLAGFGVRCQKRDKVYVLKTRVRGRQRWFTIGKHGAPWTPDTARKEALSLMGEVAGGGDPAVKRKVVIAPTLREVAQAFLEEHVDRKRKSSTAAHYRDCLNRLVLPVLGDHRVTELTHADVADWHGDLEGTPYQANRALAVLSALFSFAEKRDTVAKGSNPCRGVDKFPESSRERYLTSEEISRLGDAMEKVASESRVSPYTLAAIRLLLLTGARRGEILNLKWEYVDFERAMLFLPDSKTGRKSIPLNALALDLLRGLPRQADNPWVVRGRKPEMPLVELKTAWRSILKLAGLSNVRIHDLRHTFASIAAGEGASLLLIGKLLGHRNPQTTQRYAHLANDPVRAAGELVGNSLTITLGAQNSRAKQPT